MKPTLHFRPDRFGGPMGCGATQPLGGDDEFTTNEVRFRNDTNSKWGCNIACPRCESHLNGLPKEPTT